MDDPGYGSGGWCGTSADDADADADADADHNGDDGGAADRPVERRRLLAGAMASVG